MKICLIAEGCYPYVVGGVSGWIHSMIQSFPEVEFVVLAIISNRSQSGKFVYELPENVSAVYEAYLDDYDWGRKPKHGRRTGLDEKEYRALRSIVMNEKVDWDTIFDMFQKGDFSIDDLLMGADFLNIVKEYYNLKYPHIVFSDFLWTMRSIYLPLFLILETELPKADIYHCVATGYAGVLGSMASHFYRSGLLISEHGIYTREREEELLKAGWVAGIYKNIWIDQFKKMSRLAYERADVVTSLYSHARDLQIGLGCPAGKIRVTPNGIDVEKMADIPGKREEDKGFINIGAVLRVTPIKDVKTMIRAFAFAKEENDSLKLWIMGPWDEDEEYAKECFALVEALQVKDIIFTGRIQVKEYLGRMDYTILTSISEGQPLTILESYAAHKPVIATDVGNCRELIYGEGDECGTAGILTHIMNIAELSSAMLELARSSHLRATMGECGYRRVMKRYRIQQMKQSYEDIYEQIGWLYGKLWPAETYHRGQVRVEKKYEENLAAQSLGYASEGMDGYDIDVEFGPGTGSGYDIDYDVDGDFVATNAKSNFSDIRDRENADISMGDEFEQKAESSISKVFDLSHVKAMGRVVGLEISAEQKENTEESLESTLEAQNLNVICKGEDVADRGHSASDGSGNGIVIDYENLISRYAGRSGKSNVGYQGSVSGIGSQEGKSLNNVINNAMNNTLNHAINDAVNEAVTNAVNRVDSALNVMINDAVNQAIEKVVNQAVNQAVNNAVGQAVNHAVNQAVNNAVGQAVNSAINQAVNHTVNNAVHNALNNALCHALHGTLDNVLEGEHVRLESENASGYGKR
ncbi:MAG: GT4 family glycosyltransferase PelF [Lachnospiraceae bacterium]|nr:GT4 family glycosyltransferase PelF [Lachnospiraceae bacterium]